MELASANYNDPGRRLQLNRLVLEVFGLDLSPWNQLGFEFEDYTPFTFIDGGRAVANVSASPMQLTLEGRDLTAVQVGTVCTLPERRGSGLIRELMDRAHEFWEGRCEFSYLHANDTVLEFYQQFGYRPVVEHYFACAAPVWRPASGPVRKLRFQDPEDREMMRVMASERAPVSRRAGVRDQAWLWLFHARIAHPERLHLIEDLGVVAITRKEGEVLHLYDLMGTEIPTLEEVYPYLGDETIRQVQFHFTPDLMGVPEPVTTPAADKHLFVRGEFPLMEKPFLLPATGEA